MVEEKNNPNEPKNSGVALLDKEEVKEENKEKNSTIEEDIEIKEDTDTGKGEEENIQQIDKKSKVGIIIFIVSIVIVLLGISSTIFAIINSNSTKIVKGVAIGPIDVSNLTIEEAKDKLEKVYTSKADKQIYLEYGEFETSITYEALEVEYQIDNAIQDAYDIGRSGNLFADNFL